MAERSSMREAIVLRLTEPALRLIVKEMNLRVVPISPLAPLAGAGKTLDALAEAARRELADLKMLQDGRINWILAAAMKVLGHPEEMLTINERAALGTRIRRFWGLNDFFVEHVANRGIHEISFAWTRAAIMGEAAIRLGIANACRADAPGRRS